MSSLKWATALLALLVLGLVNRQVESSAGFSSADVREVTLVCPRCRRKQKIAIEDGLCAKCGLGIAVRVTERSGPPTPIPG